MLITASHDECLICFKDILFNKSLHQFLFFDNLCGECIDLFHFKPSIKFHKGVPILTLFKFTEEASRILIRYKDFCDIYLASIFAKVPQLLYRLFFKEHLCVPVPSSIKNLKRRGFSHLNLILESMNVPYFDCLQKLDDKEQRSLSFKERHNIKISIKKKLEQEKSILIFDDVITSGASIIASIQALRTQTNTLFVLVLFAGSDYLRERSFQL